MAFHKSAKKCIRKIAKRTLHNRSRMSTIRTFLKKAQETFVASTNIEECRKAFDLAQHYLHKGGSNGLLHRNTVSRKVSKLSKAFFKKTQELSVKAS